MDNNNNVINTSKYYNAQAVINEAFLVPKLFIVVTLIVFFKAETELQIVMNLKSVKRTERTIWANI